MRSDRRNTDRKTWEGIFATAPEEWLSAPPSPLMDMAAAHLAGCRRILDLGCGFGRWAAHVARQTSARVVGIDYTIGGVVLGLALSPPRTSFVTGEATILPFSDAAFDGFLAVLIIESLESPHNDAAVHELLRVAAQGSPGFFVFNPWPLPQGAEVDNPTASCSGEYLDDQRVQQLLSPFEIRGRYVAEHGLRCVEVGGAAQ